MRWNLIALCVGVGVCVDKCMSMRMHTFAQTACWKNECFLCPYSVAMMRTVLHINTQGAQSFGHALHC